MSYKLEYGKDLLKFLQKHPELAPKSRRETRTNRAKSL